MINLNFSIVYRYHRRNIQQRPCSMSISLFLLYFSQFESWPINHVGLRKACSLLFLLLFKFWLFIFFLFKFFEFMKQRTIEEIFLLVTELVFFELLEFLLIILFKWVVSAIESDMFCEPVGFVLIIYFTPSLEVEYRSHQLLFGSDVVLTLSNYSTEVVALLLSFTQQFLHFNISHFWVLMLIYYLLLLLPLNYLQQCSQIIVESVLKQ